MIQNGYPSISNFRELGGLRTTNGQVRTGVLYRSSHLAHATDTDLTSIAMLGITRIVDFRLPADIDGDGGEDRIPPGVEHTQLGVTDTSGRNAEIRSVLMSQNQALIEATYGDGKGHAMAAAGVVAMAVEPEKQAVFSQFLQLVVRAAGEPVLWHCSAGKDRAGWAATLLGIALQVPDAALVDHYLESNIHRLHRVEHYESLGLDIEAIRPFLLVHQDYIDAGLAAVDAGWPTRDAYLRDALSLSPDQLETLRTNLIT